MKKILLLALCSIAVASFSAQASEIKEETLHYKVMFRWGLVHKQAGRATLTLKNSGAHFTAALYARSEKWADRFFSVRDTLVSTMTPADMLPVRYERIAHEGGSYARDIVTITRSGSSVTGEAIRYRRKKNSAPLLTSTSSLKASGPTVDLLSVFYYLRTIDFKALSPGYTKTINIFSGKRKELLNIRYHGTENLEVNGIKYSTYRISFTFTDEASSKTSDNINTWIWTNPSHIPIKLEGKLKVGKIQCLFTGNE